MGGTAASFDNIVVFNSTVVANHHLRHRGRHDRRLQICARKPGDILQRAPLCDDKEFDTVTEGPRKNRGADETRKCPQRGKSISTK